MSNIMVNTYLADTRPGDRPDPKAQVDPGREDNFARYLDKKVRSEHRARSAQLGVKHRAVKDQQTTQDKKQQKTADRHEDSGANIAAFLQQLSADLKKLSAQPNQHAAGEWSFQLKSMDMLRKLAAAAGMSNKELAVWQKQLNDKGMINLRDILAALEQHFQAMRQPETVTAPESDLPVMESMLERMGVDPAALSALAAKSVDDNGGFDLKAYLKGLEKLSAARLQAQNSQAAHDGWRAVKVSNADMRQFRDMLGAAGLTRGQLLEMFPDSLKQALSAGGQAGGGQETMSMARLQELLGQTVNMVEDAKPEIKPVGFLNNLVDVLQQAGFVKKDTSWSPVVQKSLTAIYQQLQKMVDLSKVKVDKINEIMRRDEALTADWQKSSLTDTDTDAGMTDGKKLTGQAARDSDLELVKDLVDGHDSKGRKSENGGVDFSSLPSSAVPVDSRAADAMSAVRPRTPPTPVILPQFAFEQISQGVTQALQRDDHHLVLTMYPKELGEVKVDLQVRNNHVMVSFVMDNHRVKETLEKNMDEFKQNLNQQGYNLESCMVMVDQHNNSEDSRQRFESAWEQLSLDKGRKGGGKAAALETSASLSRALLRADRWADSRISVLV
ncbi:MAG TPA: flagellar hook-length control protein FliK [Desulfobacterales bacterium]|nr:flagellar hook-length control protein FliK [Desulfobacterales bacterium]